MDEAINDREVRQTAVVEERFDDVDTVAEKACLETLVGTVGHQGRQALSRDVVMTTEPKN